MTYFERVASKTNTRFWINNVTREQARLAIAAGAVGCTQNPSYVYKMLTTSDEAEREYVFTALDSLLCLNSDADIQAALQKRLVEEIASAFMPMYRATHGKYGYVSIQGDPFREDVDSMVSFALSNTEKLPNLMAKIPATKDGLAAIEILAEKGVPINATEVMSVSQALALCEIYERVSRKCARAPVFYFSHIAGIFDDYIKMQCERDKIDIHTDVTWEAGISVAKKIYEITKSKCPDVGLIEGGARGLHHFTEMVGADACVTINWEGTADELIKRNPPVLNAFMRPVPHETIDELCEKLDTYRKAYFSSGLSVEEYEEFGPVVLFRTSFETAWKKSLQIINERRSSIRS